MRVTLLTLIIALTIVTNAGRLFAAVAPGTEQSNKSQAILDAPPPDPNLTPRAELLKIYLERARTAAALGDIDRQLREINEGIRVVGPKDPLSYLLYDLAGRTLIETGDFPAGRSMRENALQVTNDRGNKFYQANFLAGVAVRLFDKEGAKKYLATAEELFAAVRANNRDWPQFRDLWEAVLSDAKGNVNSMLGYLKEAEVDYRTCVTAIRAYLEKIRKGADGIWYPYLPRCLSRAMAHAAMVGKVREAAAYINDARDAARLLAQTQRRDNFEAATVANPIARVYLEQGLIREATGLLETAIAQLQKAPGGEAGIGVFDMRYLLAESEMAQGNWLKADELFKAWRDGLRLNKQQSAITGTISPDWGYVMLRLGRIQEGLKMIAAVVKFRESYVDEGSVRLWEGRAFHALGFSAAGQRDAAVKTLAAAIPKILELRTDKNTSAEHSYLSTARLNWFLDGYIALLADMHQRGARVEGIEPAAEAFRIADAARGSKVQKALSAAIIRANSSDPESAAAMRRAQDLEHAVRVASESLTILQGSANSPEKTQSLANAQAELVRLRQENEKAQAELRLKMPNYTELMEAKALTIADAQKLLRPDEALISLYTTQDKTLVWAVTAKGQPSFNVVDLPHASIVEIVARLRKSLDPSDVDIDKLPAFDYDTVYDLYRKLLAPVEPGWKGARELIIVSHGALSELPLSVLLTTSFKPVKTSQSALPLAEHADWVVLSACNTASADGQASEAVSGLGRAFFFAGAKALLVSHWPVETVSAKLLTTELFRRQSANQKLSRAEAMRQASLAVMQQSAKTDRGPVYSYAHPMFWAPFVVVGDGG